MSKLLAKKVLDAEILNRVVKYYRINKEDMGWGDNEFANWECFSHPSLELHECNCRARLSGGHTCKRCDHVVGRSCLVSCDFQNFCLAVFAWRIGIGGEEFDEALCHNLYKLRAEELYDEVIKKFSTEAALEFPEISTEIKEKLNVEDVDPDFEVQEESSMGEVNQDMVVLTVPQDQEPELEDLLTIKEAAAMYGCTYANIYNYVNAGSLPSVLKGRRKFVQKGELLKFKDRPRSKKSKKN